MGGQDFDVISKKEWQMADETLFNTLIDYEELKKFHNLDGYFHGFNLIMINE